MNALAPWQQRVVAEHAQLNERISKLIAYLGDKPIGFPDVNVLHTQLYYMKRYEEVLAKRIGAFE